ncbi:MAG: UMP kinase [Bacilli bacterium]|nr:UMP kinase [Bacilli bacterium]
MKRVVLKVSGGSLKGENIKYNLDLERIRAVCEDVKNLREASLEVIIVVGGGNFWRGRNGHDIDRVLSDHIGMLGTISNALILANKLNEMGVKAEAMSSLYVESIIPRYEVFKAREALANGKVVVLGAGTGLPYFSTDMAVIQRARELKADTILLGKSPAGVYSKDPNKYKDAKKYDELSSLELLKIHISNGVNELAVMDFAAEAVACQYEGDIYVFDTKDSSFIKAIKNNNLDKYAKENFTIIKPNKY